MQDMTGGENGQVPAIGAISYLNALPLTCHLTDCLPEAHVHYDLPSHLADRLRRGEFDVALIPSVELMRIPDIQLVSDTCIACDGPVRSVKLASRVPISKISSMAIDEGSRTSECLARVLLQRLVNVAPERKAWPLDESLESIEQDAALVIGDRAIHVEPSEQFPHVWDLGEHWKRLTGLPFVFAVWVARTDSSAMSGSLAMPDNLALSADNRLANIAQKLSAARDHALGDIRRIATDEAARHDLTTDECVHYFTECLKYTLGPKQRESIRLFHEMVDQLEPDSDTEPHGPIEGATS